MSNFIQFLQRARMTLLPLSGSSEIRNTSSVFREQKVDQFLADFRREFTHQYRHLSDSQKATFQELIHDTDFENEYFKTEDKTLLLVNEFRDRFSNFSPLHPAYPLLNVFADINHQLSGLQATESGVYERLLQELSHGMN